MAGEDTQGEAEIITVGKREDNSRMIWDRDPLHPANYNQAAGEVVITDMRPYKVHRSAGIGQKISEKELRELSDSEASKRTQAYDEQQNEIREHHEAVREARAGAPDSGGNIVQPVAVTPIEVEEEDDEESQRSGDANVSPNPNVEHTSTEASTQGTQPKRPNPRR